MENSQKLSKFEQAILRVFTMFPYEPLNSRQIAARLGSPDKQSRDIIFKILNKMAKSGMVTRISTEKFKFNAALIPNLSSEQFAIGSVDIRYRRQVFVEREDTGESVSIRSGYTLNACHQDKVKIFLFPQRPNKDREGQIVEVLQRIKTTFVGTLVRKRSEWFLKCDSLHVPFRIHIDKLKTFGLPENTKVLVKVTDWKEETETPEGIILQDFGQAGDNEAEMMTILSEYNFPFKFSERSMAEVRKLSEEKQKYKI